LPCTKKNKDQIWNHPEKEKTLLKVDKSEIQFSWRRGQGIAGSQGEEETQGRAKEEPQKTITGG